MLAYYIATMLACLATTFFTHPPCRELRYHIKLALNSGSRQDVEVRIEIPFDPIVFTGGLQQAGTFVRKYRGHSVYKITAYGDLSSLLGPRWHLRGLNHNDFCYVNLETVFFHLHHRKSFEDFNFGSGETTTESAGSTLVFKFVRMDRTKAQWDSIVRLA